MEKKITVTVKVTYRKAYEFNVDEFESGIGLVNEAFRKLHREIEQGKGYCDGGTYDYNSDYEIKDEDGEVVVSYGNMIEVVRGTNDYYTIERY